MKKVVIIGDSHASCLNVALRDKTFRASLKHESTALVVTSGNVISRFVFTLANGETILNPIVSNQFSPSLKLAKTFWADNHVFLYFGSVEHNRYALLKHEQPFNFFDQDGGAGAQGSFVTHGLIQGFFEEIFASYEQGMALIAELSGGKFFVLQGPPPPPDAKFVEDYLHAHNYVPADAENVMMPTAFRRKMYKVATGVLRASTEKHGGIFVPVPAEAFDEEGMLRPDLVSDPFHANTLYGRLILTRIDQLLTEFELPIAAIEPEEPLIAEPVQNPPDSPVESGGDVARNPVT